MYFVSVCFPEFIFLLLKPIFILLLMPANRNALIRYKTIDNCLRNPYRRWTVRYERKNEMDTLPCLWK